MHSPDLIDMEASVDCAVLVQGETGTGKEVIARAIHDASFSPAEPICSGNLRRDAGCAAGE